MIIAAAREMAAATIPTISSARFDNATVLFFNASNESTSPPNWTAGAQTLLGVYPDFLGPVAYLLFFLIPFGMIWMSHGETKMASILGLLTGAFVLAFLPPNWYAAAIMVMAISGVAILWKLYRGN